MKMKIDVAPETKITDIIIPPDIEEYKFITTHITVATKKLIKLSVNSV